VNFLQHILEIDRRIEDMRQEEYQKILFDFGGDAGSLFGQGLSAVNSTPNIFGGYTYYDQNGLPQVQSMPNIFGGMTYSDMGGM